AAHLHFLLELVQHLASCCRSQPGGGALGTDHSAGQVLQPLVLVQSIRTSNSPLSLCKLGQDARCCLEVLRLLVVFPEHVQGTGVVSLHVHLSPQILFHIWSVDLRGISLTKISIDLKIFTGLRLQSVHATLVWVDGRAGLEGNAGSLSLRADAARPQKAEHVGDALPIRVYISPGNVGLHALNVLLGLPTLVEVQGQTLGVGFASLVQAELHHPQVELQAGHLRGEDPQVQWLDHALQQVQGLSQVLLLLVWILAGPRRLK
ncbi:hypothetical protein EGW08_018814, partial [Elysia chlorotica]